MDARGDFLFYRQQKKPPFGGLFVVRLHHLYLDIDTGGEAYLRKRFHDCGVDIHYVDEALVYPQFELLARVLMDKGRTVHRVLLDLRRERHGADYFSVEAPRGFYYLARGAVDELMVERLYAQAQLFHFLLFFDHSCKELTG